MSTYDDEELLNYSSDDDALAPVQDKAPKRVGHVGIHTCGFKDFLLKPALMRAIQDCGFEHPSEVQAECVPQAVLGMDVLCQAKSGMGKTAVFVLTTLQQLDHTASLPQVVVLCHTRELAYQIDDDFKRFTKYLPDVACKVVFGGVPLKLDRQFFSQNTPQIVVGTPGRMLGLVDEKTIDLSGVKHFVIDECDEMLDATDMRRQVQGVFKATPREKQVMMFSATLSNQTRTICRKFMTEPVMEVFIDDESKLTLHGLQQHFVKLAEDEKNRKLNDLLDALEFNQVIIFVKSTERAKSLNKLLVDCNFPSVATYGRMKQDERIEVYRQFKNFEKRVLVSTDLLGRGVDIEKVNIVINYDMPEAHDHGNSTDSYLHRVGRAGRFGTKGLAISFVSTDEDKSCMANIQTRFEVNVTELPDTIDTSSYMYS